MSPSNGHSQTQFAESGPRFGTEFKHGTIYGYKRQGCRCDRCRAANASYSQRTTDHAKHREANRRWYANRKAGA